MTGNIPVADDLPLLLSPEQAFDVMREFLQLYWSEMPSATVGDVLSESAYHHERETADPASWHDWMRAIKSVMAR